MQLLWLFAMLLLVWYFPSTQEIMHKFKPALAFKGDHREPRVFNIKVPAWRPHWLMGAASAVVVLSLTFKLLQGQAGEFIYFQF